MIGKATTEQSIKPRRLRVVLLLAGIAAVVGAAAADWGMTAWGNGW
ncbi:hypothetical protein [Kitasatospora sp. NPDC059571]